MFFERKRYSCSINEIEMINVTELKFDAAGLIPAIIQDADTRVVWIDDPVVQCRDRAFR